MLNFKNNVSAGSIFVGVFPKRMSSTRIDEETVGDVSQMGDCDHAFCGLVKQELQDLRITLRREILSFKEECFAKQDHAAKILESWSTSPKVDVHSNTCDGNEFANADQTPVEGTRVAQPWDNMCTRSPVREAANDKCLSKRHSSTYTDLEDQDNEEQCELYKELIESSRRGGMWRQIYEFVGMGHALPEDMPDNCFARSTHHPIISSCSTLLILANVCIMGYETNVSIKAVLRNRSGEVPSWVHPCNSIFNVIFGVELLYRMAALRSWFWTCPSWGWNLFDFFVVVTSLVSDAVDGLNFTFIRMFRILRAVRVVRLIRVLRFFRELRKMLSAILACLASLVWTFVFLTLTIFIFSILLLQGVTQALEEMTEQEYANARDEVAEWYPTLTDTMFSLLVAVTGGQDWLDIHKPIHHAGFLYSAAFLVYIIFVLVGVMNVLTGIFLTSADEMLDHAQIVQTETIKLEKFVRDMLVIFNEMDVQQTGEVDWHAFKSCMRDSSLQAYFAAHDIDPTHSRVLFDLLAGSSGRMNVTQLVMGALRLKGEAKAIDARIIRQQIEELAIDFKKVKFNPTFQFL